MSPVSPFGVYVMYVYNFVLIVTAVLFALHYEYFWVGLLVMATLVLLVWLQHSWWVIEEKLRDLRKYKDAVKTNDPEKIECARRDLKEDSLWYMASGPLIVAGIVALVGLFAIPLWVVGRITDTIKFRRRLASQK